MNYLNKFFYYENIKIKVFLVLSFLISWLSLGSSFEDLIINYKDQEKNLFYEIVNFVRTSLNILIFVLLSFFYFKNFKKKNYKNFLNIFVIFFFYLILQIPGLFITLNVYDNLYFIMSSLNIILIFYLANKFFKYDEVRIFIYVSFYLMFFVLLFAFSNHFFQYIIGERHLFYGNPLLILENSPIRSSGAGRLSLIILIIYTLILLPPNNKKFLRLFGVTILSTIVFLYQSRANIALLGIFVIIYIFYRKDFSLKKILEYLFSFFIVPILLVFLLPILKSFILANISEIIENKDHFLYSPLNLLNSTTSFDIGSIKHKKAILRDIRMDTSGRYTDWTKLFNNFNYNDYLLFGYGSQGDRYLINQTASNGFIYAFVSSGIIGFFFYIIFLLIILTNSIKYLFNRRIKDTTSFSSLVILILLLIRSLIESSFAVFGIDFILVFMSSFIINKKLNN